MAVSTLVPVSLALSDMRPAQPLDGDMDIDMDMDLGPVEEDLGVIEADSLQMVCFLRTRACTRARRGPC